MIFSGKYGWKASMLRRHLPLQQTQAQPHKEKNYQNASQNGDTEEIY